MTQLGSPARPGDPAGPGDAEPRRRRTLLPEFLLLVIGAEVCRHLAWPVRSAGLAFAVAAVVVGVLVYGRVRYEGARWQTFAVTVGLIGAGVLVFAHVLLTLSGLFLSDYEDCVREALTRGAQQTCRAQLEDRVAELLGGG